MGYFQPLVLGLLMLKSLLLGSFDSENYIFGKFDTFCRRLEKLAEMASTLESLQSLGNMKVHPFHHIVC
jgi:hypothetical protein